MQPTGKLLAINWPLAWIESHVTAKHLIDAGTIGDPQYVLVELSRKPYRQGASGWRYDQSRVGSWVLEEPVHFLDLLLWYFGVHGVPASVQATATPGGGRGGRRTGEWPT